MQKRERESNIEDNCTKNKQTKKKKDLFKILIKEREGRAVVTRVLAWSELGTPVYFIYTGYFNWFSPVSQKREKNRNKKCTLGEGASRPHTS